MGVVFCLSVGYVAHADIVINEIAWMGTATSTADEWIELYNNGTSSVNIDGWSLSASDGSPAISLSGSISAGGYAVLERTDDTTVPGVTALVIYTGALSNDGEHLILKNNTSQTIDEINALSGWLKGDADTKKTMQKNSGVWVTGTATPGLVNITTDDTSSSGGGGSGSGSTTTTPTKTLTANEEDTEKIEIYKDPTYSARMVLPNIIVAGNPFPVSAIVMQDEKYKLLTGKYEWSMGDGAFFTYNENKLFDYMYQYQGEYIIQFRYYPSVFSVEPSSLHEKKIIVIPDAVYIEQISDRGVVTLKNMSTNTVDIKGWKIVNSITGDSFVFPTTSVPVNGQIHIGPEKTGKIFPIKNTILLNASGTQTFRPVSGKNITNTGLSLDENNPYDILSATGDIELLSDINPDAFVIKNDIDTESRFGASVYQLSNVFKNILRQGKSPIVVLVLLLGILSGMFFLAEYYIHKKQHRGTGLGDDEISGDTRETML